MSTDNPTNGELKIMLDNLSQMTARIETIAIDTNEKATKTNGRVNRLEEHDEKYNKALFDETNGLITWRERMWGWLKGITIGGSIILVIVPILFTLYIKSLKTDIIDEASNKVVATLEARYDTAIK